MRRGQNGDLFETFYPVLSVQTSLTTDDVSIEFYLKALQEKRFTALNC